MFDWLGPVVPRKGPIPLYAIAIPLVVVSPFMSVEIDLFGVKEPLSFLLSLGLSVLCFASGYGIVCRNPYASIGGIIAYGLLAIIFGFVFAFWILGSEPTTQTVPFVIALALGFFGCISAVSYLLRRGDLFESEDA